VVLECAAKKYDAAGASDITWTRDGQYRTVSSVTVTRCTQHIGDFLIMRYVNLHFTYLLTYCRP